MVWIVVRFTNPRQLLGYQKKSRKMQFQTTLSEIFFEFYAEVFQQE